MTKKEKIEILIKHLTRASETYYNQEPIITDDEFDKLRDTLEELDPQNAYLSDVGAPTPKSGWPTHKHRAFMGSLAKCSGENTKEDFFKWAKDKGDEFVLSEKYDGSTIVATYKDGKLQTLATRGSGLEGEDITPNASVIKNVPAKLPEPFSGEIRGEALLRVSIFEKYFRPAGHSNPRNTANGKVRDMKENPLKSHIEVMWFDIFPTDRDLKTETEKWDLIHRWGLDSDTQIPGTQLPMTAEEAWQEFEIYAGVIRAKLDHEIDGLVIKVNNLEEQESYGVSSKKPKGAIAIKFASAQDETEVLDIEWSRGLTGVIAPVAILSPVNIGGVNISRASLCGIEEIQRLGVSIGDRVIVSRRNDVIPKIERVISRVAGRADHQPPTKCDLCDEELARDGAYIYCFNEECQGETYGSLMTWIKEFKIKGFGPSMVRALITEDVKTVHDLYTAEREVFHRAAGSEKNGNRRHDALHEFDEVRLSTFLSALNIRALGTTNGQRLEKKFETLDKILAAKVEDLQTVPGIKTNAKKIHAGLQKNIALIRRLNSYLLIKSLDKSGPLAGKSFCVTGDLTIPRPQIHDWIKDLGGEIKSGVSKTLSYLVTDDPDSGTGKNKKADKYSVTKLTEEGLYELAGVRP